MVNKNGKRNFDDSELAARRYYGLGRGALGLLYIVVMVGLFKLSEGELAKVLIAVVACLGAAAKLARSK